MRQLWYDICMTKQSISAHFFFPGNVLFDFKCYTQIIQSAYVKEMSLVHMIYIFYYASARIFPLKFEEQNQFHV